MSNDIGRSPVNSTDIAIARTVKATLITRLVTVLQNAPSVQITVSVGRV